jgi:hypothetical protein
MGKEKLHFPKEVKETPEQGIIAILPQSDFEDLLSCIEIIADYFKRKGLKDGIFAPEDFDEPLKPDAGDYHGE